jgi:hypothetical protein
VHIVRLPPVRSDGEANAPLVAHRS